MAAGTEGGGPGAAVLEAPRIEAPKGGGPTGPDLGSAVHVPTIDTGQVAAMRNPVDALGAIAAEPPAQPPEVKVGGNPEAEAMAIRMGLKPDTQAPAPDQSTTGQPETAQPQSTTEGAVGRQPFEPGLRSPAEVAALLDTPTESNTGAATPSTENTGRPDQQPKAPQPEVQPDAQETTVNRRQELEAKNPRDLTPAEIKELNDLRKDPQERMKALEDKFAKGQLNDEEAAELGKLYGDEATNTEANQEQQEAKLEEQIADLAGELMDKVRTGQEITPEDYSRVQELKMKQLLAESGITDAESKQIVQDALKRQGRSTKGHQRKVAAAERVKTQIKELMTIEMQIIMLPQNLEPLTRQRETLKTEARSLRGKPEAANTYAQLANVNAAIVQLRYAGFSLQAKHSLLESQVRRKLGVTGFVGGLAEVAGQRVINAMTQLSVAAAENVDYASGQF